ncbi:hypothetical protein [Streptomyces sp. NBC_00233]|uniref:hypothetical protein n=1 Tax=Streptomyces sp. NBC_00233 TaxID=2975686 RepID=UPI002255D03D|nr:hypothetical protein [Streptomyces sp. NBC_00233]MCX5233270.1 hypothetical protein [Streptomyces sp. NBC_00233]
MSAPEGVDEQLFLAFHSPLDQLPEIIDAVLDLMPPVSKEPSDMTPPEVKYLMNISADYRDSLHTILKTCNSPYDVRRDGRGLTYTPTNGRPFK